MKNKKLFFSLALGVILIAGAGALALNTASFQGRFSPRFDGPITALDGGIEPVLCSHAAVSPVATTIPSTVPSTVITGSTTPSATVTATIPATVLATFPTTIPATVIATLPATIVSTLFPSGTVTTIPSTVPSTVTTCVPYSLHEGNLPEFGEDSVLPPSGESSFKSKQNPKSKWWQKARK